MNRHSRDSEINARRGHSMNKYRKRAPSSNIGEEMALGTEYEQRQKAAYQNHRRLHPILRRHPQLTLSLLS